MNSHWSQVDILVLQRESGTLLFFWFDVIFWIYVANLALWAKTGRLAPECHYSYLLDPDGLGTGWICWESWSQHIQWLVILLMRSVHHACRNCGTNHNHSGLLLLKEYLWLSPLAQNSCHLRIETLLKLLPRECRFYNRFWVQGIIWPVTHVPTHVPWELLLDLPSLVGEWHHSLCRYRAVASKGHPDSGILRLWLPVWLKPARSLKA